MAASPPILFCAPAGVLAEDVQRWLGQTGQSVRRQELTAALEASEYPLVLLAGGPAALDCCRRLRVQGNGTGPLILLIGETSERLTGLEAGADAYLGRPFTPQELVAQVEALQRIYRQQARLAEQTSEAQRLNQRLEQAYHQIDQELIAARQIQQSFLPKALPQVLSAHLAVYHRPCGRVGGDFYDAFRLDEEHIGLYVADVMGHGVPASLLTIFLKQAVKAKEITGKQYRLVPPDEVLQRLNRALIDQALPDMPFVTMLYVLLNCRSGELSFSRAGHPHPIHIPSGGEPRSWPSSGGLLGVFPDQFPAQKQKLAAGDKLLLYTDGLDPNDPGSRAGLDRLRHAAARHTDLPIGPLIEKLALELLDQTSQQDDCTLLGVELAAPV